MIAQILVAQLLLEIHFFIRHRDVRHRDVHLSTRQDGISGEGDVIVMADAMCEPLFPSLFSV